ncbi:uncharacterized protein V6R79_024035 [Siganus canaliculatus]
MNQEPKIGENRASVLFCHVYECVVVELLWRHPPPPLLLLENSTSCSRTAAPPQPPPPPPRLAVTAASLRPARGCDRLMARASGRFFNSAANNLPPRPNWISYRGLLHKDTAVI